MSEADKHYYLDEGSLYYKPDLDGSAGRRLATSEEKLLLASNAALKAENEALKKKAYEQTTRHCPECGSNRWEHGAGLEKSHRGCLDCGQEWFTDVAYESVPGYFTANAALTASLASVKNDWEIASRVASNYKAQLENAVRIGCENITAREKSEATLAELRRRMEIARLALEKAEHGLIVTHNLDASDDPERGFLNAFVIDNGAEMKAVEEALALIGRSSGPGPAPVDSKPKKCSGCGCLETAPHFSDCSGEVNYE